MPVTSTPYTSEVQLLQQLLVGNLTAWRVFVQQYDRFVWAGIDSVLRRFPRYNTRVERDDIHATLLLSLLARDKQKLRVFRFERGVRFSTWLSLLAARATRDHVRAARVRSNHMRPLTATELNDEGALDPLASLLDKEAASRVLTEIEYLSLKDRQLLELSFVQARAPEQVAAIMKISVDTVYTKKHKLRLRLQQVLALDRTSVRLAAVTPLTRPNRAASLKEPCESSSLLRAVAS